MRSNAFYGNINRNYLFLSILLGFSLSLVGILPKESIPQGQGICLHYILTGIQCPFCGCIRGVNSFLHLEFAEALRLNFNVFIMALFLPVILARVFISPPWLLRLEKFMLASLVSGFVLIYLFRVYIFFRHP